MTDITKQEAKDKFKKMVESGVDELLSKDLSQEEVDLVIMQEVGSALGEMTAMNNISADLANDAEQTVIDIKKAEKSISDLEKQLKIREELDIAA